MADLISLPQAAILLVYLALVPIAIGVLLIMIRLGQAIEARLDVPAQRPDATSAVDAYALTRIGTLERDLALARGRIDELLGEKHAVDLALTDARKSLDYERADHQKHIAIIQGATADMRERFRTMAEELLHRQGSAIADRNTNQIETLLIPLKEKLSEFHTRMDAVHSENLKERSTLAAQIGQLFSTSSAMMAEASSLTKALKGQSHTQGAWGELILERALEASGLKKDVHFKVQQSLKTDDGQRLRPDVLIPLNDEHCIVVDAKVSLTAFVQYTSAQTDKERSAKLDQHVASIQTHVRTLSQKAYETHARTPVDFVIMFIPIESALAAALDAAPDLASEALAKNVCLATPTTLLIALRTIASVLRTEQRHRNTEEISRLAGQLYDKFVTFTQSMIGVRKGLDQARGAYDLAIGQLSTGQGNLISRAERLKELGVTTSKSLPVQVLPLDTDDDDGLHRQEILTH